MATRPYDWFTTPEEDAALAAESRKEYERLESILEYRKEREDSLWLCSFLTSLLYNEREEFCIEPPSNFAVGIKDPVAYRMGRAEPPSTKSLTYDSAGYETKVYRDFSQFNNFAQGVALGRYAAS